MDIKEYKQKYNVDVFVVGCSVLGNQYKAYFPIMSVADFLEEKSYPDPARIHLVNVIKNLMEKISLGNMVDDDLVAIIGGCIQMEKNGEIIDPMSVDNTIAKLLAERWVTAMGFFDTPRVYTADVDGSVADVVELIYAGRIYKIYLRPLEGESDSRMEHVLKLMGREYNIDQTYDVFSNSVIKMEAAPFGRMDFVPVESIDKVLFANAIMAWVESAGSIEYDYDII